MWKVEREPSVPMSYGVASVSRGITRTNLVGMLSTSATICAMTVSEPCPMSTVPQDSVTEPSADTLTMATDVVGDVTALMAMAMPRPRLTGPLPLSNGCDQLIRSRTLSSTARAAHPR